MRRAEEARGRLGDLRAVYADLDGTVLGPGGSIFAAPDGGVTERTVAAVRSLHEAGVPLVLMSGRTRRGIGEVARVLGAAAYIAELGALIVERDGPGDRVIQNFGDVAGPPAELIARSGAAAYLLERFPRQIRAVAPWTEATAMFEGFVDPAEANVALEEAGYGWLEFHDNGRMRRRIPTLDVPEVHALHLLPRGVTKASAVRLHREAHGIATPSAIAVGDSPSDLVVAGAVGAFFLVANGAPASGAPARVPENAYLTTGSYGEGFAEAVAIALEGPGRRP